MLNPIHIIAGIDFAGTAQKLRDIRDVCGEVVITFSVIANFMPKVEAVIDPAFKRVYHVLYEVVEYLAMNRIRVMYAWISKRKSTPAIEVTK